MKAFTSALALWALLATGSQAANCPNVCSETYLNKPCKNKSEVPSGYAGFFTGTGPCFPHPSSGSPVCFNQGGSISTCNPYKAACGFPNPPAQKSLAECGLAANTGITSSSEINTIVDYHNELRNRIAGGGDSQPQAANMREMRWDAKLATRAQEWAETMGPEDSHDEQSVRGRCFYEYGEKLGQNCAFRTDSSKTRTQLIRGGIKAWFDEITDLNQAEIASFDGGKKSSGVIGHYTQVVWAESDTVGCAFVSRHGWGMILVCNYGQAGNTNTLSVYEEGAPASKCCPSMTRSTKWTNLCV